MVHVTEEIKVWRYR